MKSKATFKVLFFSAIIWLAADPLPAVPQYIPVTSSYFSMGQYYFDGRKSAIGGNASLTLVPAIRYSNRFSLIPTLESSYRGTRSAEELAGGSTLFQDTWENGIGLKAVHGLGPNLKIKERVGFRSKWFRETTDESWNDGLFDYRVLNLGMDVQYEWSKKMSVGAGYDFSLLNFPNYVSLESTQGNDRAREFAGENVLDTRIHLLSLQISNPFFWKISHQWQAFYSPRFYRDQTVVQDTGLLSATKRKDSYVGLSFSGDRYFRLAKNTSLITTLRYSYSTLRSNQNHYDAKVTTFINDFYDYGQQAIGPQFVVAFGSQGPGPKIFETGYSYSVRRYTERPQQSEEGTYLTDKLYIRETLLNFGFSYPLSKNFRLKTTASFGRSRSNNHYESLYRYNYNNYNYQFGFTYDY